MNEKRHGDWSATYSGKKYYPMDPRPEDVSICDISHALSMICRFGGHCNQFYSVATHSYLASSFIKDDKVLAIKALLHDASEAYIHDIIRPLKPCIVGYKEIEDKTMANICKSLHIEWPWLPKDKEKIKEIDNRMLVTEAKYLMGDTRDWDICKQYDPYDIVIKGCPPWEAKNLFMQRFSELYV
jgi:hypothetical protein